MKKFIFIIVLLNLLLVIFLAFQKQKDKHKIKDFSNKYGYDFFTLRKELKKAWRDKWIEGNTKYIKETQEPKTWLNSIIENSNLQDATQSKIDEAIKNNLVWLYGKSKPKLWEAEWSKLWGRQFIVDRVNLGWTEVGNDKYLMGLLKSI